MVRRLICDIMILVCLIVLAYSGFQLFNYWRDSKETEQIFEEIREDEKSDISKAWKQNHDTVGWLRIPKTNIDYPVMQTVKEPQFYLHRDFKKKDSLRGCLFVDAKTDLNMSMNILIYGHHMMDGSMFGYLTRYSDNGYFNEHRKVKYTFIDKKGHKEVRHYKVVAMFKSITTDKESYLDYANITDLESYNKYTDYIARKSEVSYTPPETPVELLTLSTCSYHLPRWAENYHKGRFCVIAERID